MSRWDNRTHTIYGEAGDAIRDCLKSLAPFLIEPDSEEAKRERDLVLLSDRADLSRSDLTEAIRKYFDRSSPMSKRVQYCGIALVGFDAAFYPIEGVKGKAEEIVAAARVGLADWKEKIGSRLKKESLNDLEIDLFCIPLPSAEGFRDSFLKAMGMK